MTELRIARGFTLPLDLVTEATAIVATRGAGKSSASAVLVEEGFAAGVQCVVFDRTGVYWGLRSNANGDGPGLPIYVLGGPHADVPLEPHAGVLIADLVVDSGHSFVLDLSDLSKSGAIRFAGGFLERLYDRKARARTTTLLVMDEAHFYAPQTPRGGFKGEAATLMGAMEDVVGLGRSRGLGVVLTTQRTQALNKSVLDLIETLLVMRMLSPRARDAVQDWIREKHEDDREGVIATLESLPTGTAWVWSPLRGILEKVTVRRIKTFDSYDTPKPGQTRLEPTVRRELDLDALGEQMRATAERAKENDPTELRKRIRQLERDMISRPREQVTETIEVEKIVEVPVLNGQVEKLQDAVTALRGISEAVLSAGHVIGTAAGSVADALDRWQDKPQPTVASPTRPARTAPRPQPKRESQVEASELSAYALGLLRTLAERYPMRLTRAQISTFSGRKPRSSAFKAAIAEIIRDGYVTLNKGQYEITDHGVNAVGELPDTPPNPQAVFEMWRSALPTYERDLLDSLVAAYPNGLTRQELSDQTGRSLTSSAFKAAISTLAKNGLAEMRAGEVRASDDLCEGVTA